MFKARNIQRRTGRGGSPQPACQPHHSCPGAHPTQVPGDPLQGHLCLRRQMTTFFSKICHFTPSSLMDEETEAKTDRRPGRLAHLCQGRPWTQAADPGPAPHCAARPVPEHGWDSLELAFCRKYPLLVKVQTSSEIRVRQKCTPGSKMAHHVLSWGWRFTERVGSRERCWRWDQCGGRGRTWGTGPLTQDSSVCPAGPRRACTHVLGRHRAQGLLPSTDSHPQLP